MEYSKSRQPGIIREGAPGAFVYRDPKGCLDGSLRKILAAVGEEEQAAEMWRIERMVMRFLAERQKAARTG